MSSAILTDGPEEVAARRGSGRRLATASAANVHQPEMNALRKLRCTFENRYGRGATGIRKHTV